MGRNVDFIPAGYITVREAVHRILRKTHGEDWGKKEIELEGDEIVIPGAFDEAGQPAMGRPLDREAVKTGRLQVRDAESHLRSALSSAELIGVVEDGPPVPREYWDSPGATTTMHVGILVLGAGAQPEDRQWQDRRVLVETQEFESWLTGNSIVQAHRGQRRHDVEDDARLRNKIDTVLAAANRVNRRKRLGRNQLAELLAEDDAVKGTGYKEQTIRKILNGSYSASRRLDIPGYPGIDPRVK